MPRVGLPDLLTLLRVDGVDVFVSAGGVDSRPDDGNRRLDVVGLVKLLARRNGLFGTGGGGIVASVGWVRLEQWPMCGIVPVDILPLRLDGLRFETNTDSPDSWSD